MKAMFTVGEISKLHKLDKQTLIYYDKENIFKPNIVDDNNGYRYYTADQLQTLDSILMLRDIGLPLKQIKSFLEKREPKAAAQMLEKQKEAVMAQARHLEKTARKLERKIKSLTSIDDTFNNSILLITNNEYFAVEKVLAPNSALQTDIATKKLLTRAYTEGYPFYYQVGVIVPLERLYAKEYEAAEYACIPLINKTNVGNLFIKPAGLYARGFHKGKYSDIGSSYKRLFSYIECENYLPCLHSFEYCISDSLTALNEEDYVTEIQIPIKTSKIE